MLNVSMVRARCYLILQGLERSLADNLLHNFDVDEPGFLTIEEQDRALNRLREDFEQSEWVAEDVKTQDLLVYLDLGDLLSLLNRHKRTVRNIRQSEVQAVTNIVQSQRLPGIRRRVMHPVRPLEAEDLVTLNSISAGLQQKAPGMLWGPLLEGMLLAQSPERVLEVEIPPFWTEDSTIVHNLPAAEFDDTGFIGRTTERRKLKNLLQTDRNVITIVGPGGVGKTALALRVCHDILDDPESDLERIVWVSLKTQYLTADGIRAITHAVDSTEALVDRLLSAINISTHDIDGPSWDGVLEQLRTCNTLLVIDNLETLGREIRDLAVNMPRNSKLLFTSRVGLGEIEVRYEMPDLSTHDAVMLLRSLAAAYNYASIVRAGEGTLKQYCLRLHHNPLLIKWFVQAVGKGASPADVLAKQNVGDALRFCWENVYDGLSHRASDIISTLLAASRNLSRTQLQELLQLDHVTFVSAMQELHQSNIVVQVPEHDGSVVYQVGSLVLDYLSHYHPPDNSVVKATRLKLREWQQEQDRNAVGRHTYRYGRDTLLITSNDQKIAAPHIRNALNTLRAQELITAHKSLERARELTPDWCEIYRVKAQVLRMEGRPIYEIEQAFSEAISCEDNDVSRYHYAVYLMNIEEYERALEQIQRASSHALALDIPLRSIKGLVLLRSGRILEGLSELEHVWQHGDSTIPINSRRVHGTQYSGALKRRAEQLYNLGNSSSAEEMVLQGLEVVEQTSGSCEWDSKLAEAGAHLLSEVMTKSDTTVATQQKVTELAKHWDSNFKFVNSCRGHSKTRSLLQRSPELVHAMQNSCSSPVMPEQSERLEGAVVRIRGSFGFLASEAVGEVHMDRSSLVRPTDWGELRIGQKVTFVVLQEAKGPHALEVVPE